MASLIGIAKREATGECGLRRIGTHRQTEQRSRAREVGLPVAADPAMLVPGAEQLGQAHPVDPMVRADPAPDRLAAVQEVLVWEAPRARRNLELIAVRNGLGAASQAADSVGCKGAMEAGRRTAVEVMMASAKAIGVLVLVHSSPVFRMAVIATVRASNLVAAKDLGLAIRAPRWAST